MRSHDESTTLSRLEEPLPESHLGWALVLGTVVASPVLVAALSGRQEVTTALVLYMAALVGSWVVIGVLGGAFAMVGDSSPEPEPSSESGVRDATDGTSLHGAVAHDDPATLSR